MRTVLGIFGTMIDVEKATTHLLEEYGIARADIAVTPDDRSSGVETISLSVDIHDDEVDAVIAAFRNAGANTVTQQ